MKQYLVVGRSNSSAIFDGEAHIRIRVDIEGRLVNLLIAAHTVTNKNVKEDRGLYFECYGEADSISDAVEAFANRANTLAGIIAVAPMHMLVTVPTNSRLK